MFKNIEFNSRPLVDQLEAVAASIMRAAEMSYESDYWFIGDSLRYVSRYGSLEGYCGY